MPQEERYPELDALRGIAVLMMVIYHLVFNLAYFYGWDIAVFEGGWWLFARTTATLFLLVMGMCFMISWDRASTLAPTFSKKYLKHLKRGITIFTGGMLISLATWFVAPDAFVKFGILHLIGVSVLLQPFFQRYNKGNAFLGAAFIAIGMAFKERLVENPFLFPFGLTTSTFASLDYYSLFPWFGVILIGMALGSALYVPQQRFLLKPVTTLPYPRWLLWTGRRALVLYFLHQPILLLLLALMKVLGVRL